MNLFFTLLRRRAVLFGLLAVLLAAVIAFYCIAFSALDAVQTQRAAVSGQYTTVGIPKLDIDWQKVLFTRDGGLTALSQQDTTYPGLITEDRRVFMTAHVPGCQAVSAYERGFFSEPAAAYDAYAKSLSVLAVRCTSVSEQTLETTEAIAEKTGEDSFTIKGYRTIIAQRFDAAFSLESIVSQFSGYDNIFPPITDVHIGSGLYLNDGTLPFKEGKTYLVFGCVKPSNLIRVDYDENGDAIADFMSPGNCFIAPASYETFSDNFAMYNGAGHDFLFSWQSVEADGINYLQLDESSLPFCAEYEGSVEAFLASDAGQVWRETILPMCQTNYESAGVILTDNLESMFWFNTGDAAIIEGRSFEAPEYANGEDVCLVSATYAMKNGLSVGQELELDLYRSQLTTRTVLMGEITVVQALANVHEPCKEEHRLGIKKNYRIVGIYSAPEFETGEISFYADTIFIPKASVPNAANYEVLGNRLLYSVILENGKADEFEAALEARDCGGLFAYYDQDYNVLAETLDVMRGNALRMLWIGSALFVLVAALFLLLFFRQTADPARKLRLLGVSAKRVRRQRYLAAVLLIALASVLGAAGGAGLYGAVSTRILSSYVAMRPAALLVSTAAQAFLLLLAALICTLATANQNLMQCRKQR